MTKPVWIPKHPEDSRLFHFMSEVEEKYQENFKNYQQLHSWSVQNPALFWQALCNFFHIQFDTPPTQILNDYDTMLHAKWFSKATFNFAEKLLSRSDNHPALISVNEQGKRRVVTYRELRQQVASCAAGLRHAGVTTGDRVGAVMPNVDYTVIAMLATASIGAIWSSCSPDFGAQAIIDRFSQIEPKVLFVGNGHVYHGKTFEGREKIEQISEMIPALHQLVVCPIIHEKNKTNAIAKAVSWDTFQKPAADIEFTSLPFDHPLYILFSSGTTGKPKCIVHGAGGTLLQHMKELGLHTDLKATDNLCFYTTCGWMMWNWMVSGLALGATLTLYEGSPMYPENDRLFHLIDQEKITVFGTSAKFLSAVEKKGCRPNASLSLKSLRTILSTGSPLLPKNYDFVYEHIKSDVQLSSISGGTDIVSCFALGNPLLPVYRGELQCLGLGMSVEIFNEQGKSVKEARGELVCTKPFPSMPVSFWHDPEKKRYHHAYFEHFPGCWTHGDFAEITGHGGLIIYGRSDAILNPGGIRIGTAEIYRQVEKIPEIIDSVVIGQDWQDDVRVVLFVKLQEGQALTDDLQAAIRLTLRQNASPHHVPSKILQVNDIPRTINGKIVELAVRQTVQGQPINNLESLANPEALEEFRNREELSS
jgi:acetoacetyl-CoA synthetase